MQQILKPEAVKKEHYRLLQQGTKEAKLNLAAKAKDLQWPILTKMIIMVIIKTRPVAWLCLTYRRVGMQVGGFSR